MRVTRSVPEFMLAGALLAVFAIGVEAQTGPPVAPVRPVIDDYFGTKVSDPYRYMEKLTDPEVQSWFKAENDYTRSALAAIPGREKLLSRIKELDQSAPAQVSRVSRLPGDVYLYLKLRSGESVRKLYIRHGLTGEEKMLVDPEKVTLAPANQGKGKSAISYFEPSNDGKYIAFGVFPGGAERDTEMHVIETASGRETGDIMPRTWLGGIQWLPDGRSFFYVKFQKLPPGAPATEAEQKVCTYFHVLGRDSDKDPSIFGYGAVASIQVDPRNISIVAAPVGSRYALGVINSGVSPNSEFYIAPLDTIGRPGTPWRKIAGFADNIADVAVHGDDLYLLTFKDAPRYKVIHISAANPDLASGKTVVAASEAVITGIAAAQDALIVQLLDGGVGRLLRVSYGGNGQTERVTLPFDGAISALVTDPRLPGALLTMTSWTKAPKIYAYDPQTKRVTDTKLQPAGAVDEPSNVEAVEVKVPSYDGTLIPLSIVHPKGMKLDGTNPALLEGYGAYGISMYPSFNPIQLAWHEHAGVVAMCHVRGGGEYGEEWHLAGKGATKPNTWRDFIACAEYLAKNKYTSAAHLAAYSASAGGILVGRAITERQDAFGAAIIGVGVLDALRVETTANGVPNIAEFGSTKTQDGFKALYAMSAYHHVDARAKYPAVLLETGINDPRVDPWQSGKMAASLQAATSSGKPVLLRVDYAAGHGIGSTETQVQEQWADRFSFLLWQLGAPDFQPAH